MEISIKFDTVKSGWSTVYIEGLQVIIFKKKMNELRHVVSNNVAF